MKNSICILLIIIIFSCEKMTKKEPKVICGNDKGVNIKYSQKELNKTYLNILDPKNVTDDEHKSYFKSWSNFHGNLSKFMKEENFKWEVSDSTITIMNRLYFDENGTVDYYFFKIKNPSVSVEKREEYKNVLLKFSKDVELDIQRKEKHAQCGKTKHINY